MSDPISDYLQTLSLEQLEQLEQQVKMHQQQSHVSQQGDAASAQAPLKAFRAPAAPPRHTTEALAESMGLDISQLAREAKAWSR